MKSARVWVFSGLNDTVVSTDVVQAAERFYEAFVEDPASQIKAVYDQEGEHSQITNFYGNSCTKLGEPYINNCKYDAAGELLQHIYSNTLEAPSSQSVSGTLYSFDQAYVLSLVGHTRCLSQPTQQVLGWRTVELDLRPRPDWLCVRPKAVR